jgi:hypothetical protein
VVPGDCAGFVALDLRHDTDRAFDPLGEGAERTGQPVQRDVRHSASFTARVCPCFASPMRPVLERVLHATAAEGSANKRGRYFLKRLFLASAGREFQIPRPSGSLTQNGLF